MTLRNNLLPLLFAASVCTTASAESQISASMLSGEISFGGSEIKAPWSVSFGPRLLAHNVSSQHVNDTSAYQAAPLQYLSLSSSKSHGVVFTAFGTALAQHRNDTANQAVIPSVIWADGGSAAGSSWWATNWWIPVVGAVGVAAAVSSSDSSSSSPTANDDGRDGVCNTPSNEPGQVQDPDCEDNTNVGIN